MCASSEKHKADTQGTSLHCRWEHGKQSAQDVQSPFLSAVAHKRLAEFTGRNKDWSYRVQNLLGYLKQCPITQEDISLYKVIAGVPQVLATDMVVLANWQNI